MRQSLFEAFWGGNAARRVRIAFVTFGALCDIIRMDADTTSRKGDHQRRLEQFFQPGAAVLLGTQMIAKGLDFDEVTLVGVINADTIANSPEDFRSAERTLDLIEQLPVVLVEAENPVWSLFKHTVLDPAIRAAARYDRQLFFDRVRVAQRARISTVCLFGKRIGMGQGRGSRKAGS